MADDGQFIKAAAGCVDIQTALTSAMGTARKMAMDVPTDAVPDMREAVRAIEFATKKMAAVSAIVAKKRV